MARIYFDHNATSPLRPAARDALIAALDAGNASSVHAEGRAARAKIENARVLIARQFGVKPELVVFTSGATEAANMVLQPALAGVTCDRLLVGGGEHPCVVSGHSFGEATRVALDGEGRLDLADLRGKLAGAPMLALQAANNETGVVQPVAEAAALVHEAGGVVVCDAVQALGRVDCAFAATGADVLFVSSHKIGGPKGVGAAIFSRRAVMPAQALLRGGGQERGKRGGTENVAAIAGFAAAFSEVLAQSAGEMARLGALRDRIEADIRSLAPDAVIFGAWGAASGQHPRLRPARLLRGNHGRCDRCRGRRGFLGLGVFLRKSFGFRRAGFHGGCARDRALRLADFARVAK